MRILLVCISFLLAFSASAQTRSFRAQFKSGFNGEPIIYAKVQVVGAEQKLTNVDGYVEIVYNSGDRIMVTHLSYDTLIIRPQDYIKFDTALFYLAPRTYNLRTFTFSVLGPRVYFDSKFVKNDLGKSDEDAIREKLNIKDMRSELVGLDQSAQGGVVLGSPITAIYERYSKAGKERAKYRELIAQDSRDSAALKKFDQVVVRTLTNYDEEDIDRFIEFCSFSQSYINMVDALELYYEIIRCKEEYKAKGFVQ